MTQPQSQAGAAVQAIAAAETSLARQNSATAQVDLQVVTAVLNAHAVHADGAGDLARLQGDIEAAVSSRTDLDTPAGARAFQHYLISKLRDIRAVVETTGLDATSKAALSAALASLYASAAYGDPSSDATSEPLREASAPEPPPEAPPNPPPTDLGFGEQTASWGPGSSAPGSSVPMPLWSGAPASDTPASGAAIPSMGIPSVGLPTLGGPGELTAGGSLRAAHPVRPPANGGTGSSPQSDSGDRGATADRGVGDESRVTLPDGDTVTVSRPELEQVISAAVAGTPIPEAFAQQGIAIPPPGSPVTVPVDPAAVIAGDVGILTDRYALAIGHGKALLDNRIQPISDINGPGFLGWLHPAEPDRSRPAERQTATATASP